MSDSGAGLLVETPVIERVLGEALRRGGDFAEVFVEDRHSTSAVLDDGRVEELSSGRDRGAGVRVVVGETTGYAHTADLSEGGLLAAAEAAAAVARRGGGGRVVALEQREAVKRNDVVLLPEEVPKARKIELLVQADDAARSSGNAISQVSASYGDGRRCIQVANSDGVLVADDQVRSRFSVSCVAVGDTGMQTGYESSAFTVGFELFDTVDVREVAATAARRALVKLTARPAPSGEVPLILESGSGGILFHEACGHGLEADHIAKDASVYVGQVGELVASELVTLVDDGTVGPEWGSFAVDDEGNPARRNVLIENGVLTDYMWDFLRARKEHRESSGNGRRQSYRHLPMVRMTNTFLLNGNSEPDEILAQTPTGVYVAKLGGGQVNTTTGDFVFGTVEAYLIEDGHITEPLRDANLIGNGPEVLRRIDAVANDFAMGPGTCGKDGQSVPVGCGQPTLRITGVTIGGDGMTEAVREQAPASATVGELLELAVRVAGVAKSGEELEVYVSRGVETDVRAYEGEVESLSSAASAGVGIRVVTGGRQGFAYAGTLDEAVIRQTLAEARDNATFATADEHVGLATPDGVAPASLDLWDEELARTPSSVKVEMALELERRARHADPRVRQVAFADYGDMAAEAAVASSKGITATARRTMCSLAVETIAGADADSQTGVGFTAARGPADLDLNGAVADAVERSVRMLGATKARSGRCAVVLDSRVTSTLLAVVSAALSGEAVTKGRSFFADRIGEDVAVPSLVLVDDPTDARAFGASTHDAEGLACRRNVLIESGVLRGFVFDTTAARRAGVSSTASAVRGGYATTPGAGCRALLLSPGSLGATEILAEVGEALFVQSITGVHSGVNPVSGDFSVGAEGLMVRGGELAEPVREVTIASTLQRMLLSVLHIGADVEWLPGVAAGQTLAIDGMALSGS